MNRKAEQEFKQLVKLGIPDDTARLIAIFKYAPDSDEAQSLLLEEKDLQAELFEATKNFVKIPEYSSDK